MANPIDNDRLLSTIEVIDLLRPLSTVKKTHLNFTIKIKYPSEAIARTARFLLESTECSFRANFMTRFSLNSVILFLYRVSNPSDHTEMN